MPIKKLLLLGTKWYPTLSFFYETFLFIIMFSENFDKSGMARNDMAGISATGIPPPTQRHGMPGIMPSSAVSHLPMGGRHPPVATVRPGTHLPPQHISGFPQQVRQGLGAYGGTNGTIGPKTRAAFYLHTTMLTKIARRLSPKNLLNPRRAARSPFVPINMLAVKQHCKFRTVSYAPGIN